VVVIWTLQVTGVLSFPLAYPPLQWHRHEILFGLLNPAIAGFLLTAVCVWTGTNRLHGIPLFVLWSIWLAGRLASTWGGTDIAMWATITNLAFLPLVALDAGIRIIRARQFRQLVILVVILLLWLTQIGSLSADGPEYRNSALILAAALMLIVGGRITPAFTANWLRTHGLDSSLVRTIWALEILLLIALFLLAIAVFNFQNLVPVAACSTAAIALTRILLWRGWLVLREPLLWILHLSLLWIPIALFILAGHHIFGWPAAAWQHALGIGAMGGLILGVMTRVALGHTGRPLIISKRIVLAYASVQLATFIRLLTVFAVIPWQWGISATATAWVLAFSIFLYSYSPILWSLRVDGKPG
tara:strand:- start:347 stop:1420 length:1074 start_codon:yes stop_codon:yes gene_type:complete